MEYNEDHPSGRVFAETLTVLGWTRMVGSRRKYLIRGGEVGYVVELINYPRFPASNSVIFDKAKELASCLMEETFQGSFTVVCPDKTVFISRRDW